MTIDSFVNRLVRSFSRDLKWDEEFQIELDEESLVEAAVTRVMDRVGRPGQEALTRLLEGFVRQQVEEERNAQLIKVTIGQIWKAGHQRKHAECFERSGSRGVASEAT